MLATENLPVLMNTNALGRALVFDALSLSVFWLTQPAVQI